MLDTVPRVGVLAAVRRSVHWCAWHWAAGQPGSAGGEEGEGGRTTGHNWSATSGAVRLCRPGEEGGEASDGLLCSGLVAGP